MQGHEITFAVLRTPLTSTLVMLAGAWSAGAGAQDQAAGPADPSASSSAVLESIMVTAQRRSERIEDVPMSIASVSAERLQSAGVSTVVELSQAVPGLRFDYSGAFVQPSIRGISSALAGPGSSSNIATYTDGFYNPNGLTTNSQLMNVSSVDVVKGPQGTLFGRNATGGAIVIRTLRPSHTPTLRARAAYSSYDRSHLGFYGSTGLSDTLAGDLAAFYEEGEGFTRNVHTGREDGKFDKYALRGQLLFTPTDAAEFTFAYEHSYTDDPTANTASSYRGLSAANVQPGVYVASRRGEVSNGAPIYTRSESNAGYLTAKFNFGFADFTSLSMYRDDKTEVSKDYDGTLFPVFAAQYLDTNRTYTQEFNLASVDNERLNWVLGLYYYNNKNEYPFLRSSTGGPYAKLFDLGTEAESYAAFFDVTWEAIDRLFLTAGVRYSEDENRGWYQLVGAQPGGTTAKWSKTTPRVNVRYELTDDSSVYASFGSGYKAGLLSVASLSNGVVDPEEIDAYEIGYKVANGWLRFDAAAFYYDYTGLQVTSTLGTSSIIRNAAEAELYGADFQFQAEVLTGTTLTLGGAYTHTEYKSFPNAIAYRQNVTAGTPGYGNFLIVDTDASGNQLLRAPEFTGVLGIEHTRNFASGSLTLDANYAYSGAFYFDAVEQFRQPSYGLLNLRATWTAPSDRWSVSLFGKNVTDEKYRTQLTPATQAIAQVYGEPATIGIGAEFRY